MNTIDLELSRAEIEVRQLEARLRVVPMNDAQLLQALLGAVCHWCHTAPSKNTVAVWNRARRIATSDGALWDQARALAGERHPTVASVRPRAPDCRARADESP